MKNFHNSVIFDCDKMKHPNTGLYFFCEQLAIALQKEAVRRNSEFAVFLPSRIRDIFGGEIKYRERGGLDRLWLRLPDTVKIWHAAFQMGKYFPKSGQKTVMTIHDLNFLYEKHGARKKEGLRKIQKNIDRSDYLVAISEFTKKDVLEHLDIRNKPLDVIYNGCNLYTDKATAPRRTPDTPFLFTIGTVLPKKNFHVLPALLVGNDYELIIAGNRSIYELMILEKARQYGVKDRVKIIGSIDESEKHWYLQNCTAFVFPSIAEGFGLPVIEAMYYGKPIFLSTHTSLPEIGGNDVYYFDPEFDPEEMQRTLAAGLGHFGKHGNPERLKKRALGFSWENAAHAYWDIYDKMSL